MLWSPNEVLAYLKEDLNLPSNGTDTKKVFSKTSAFGGFPPWSSDRQDFILIAENSEIYGPNPLVSKMTFYISYSNFFYFLYSYFNVYIDICDHIIQKLIYSF